MVKTADPENLTVDQLKSQAHGAATTRLRRAHRDEFHRLLDEEYQKRGLGSYRPRLTPQERAAEEVERLLAEFPDLRGRVAQGAAD